MSSIYPTDNVQTLKESAHVVSASVSNHLYAPVAATGARVSRVCMFTCVHESATIRRRAQRPFIIQLTCCGSFVTAPSTQRSRTWIHCKAEQLLMHMEKALFNQKVSLALRYPHTHAHSDCFRASFSTARWGFFRQTAVMPPLGFEVIVWPSLTSHPLRNSVINLTLYHISVWPLHHLLCLISLFNLPRVKTSAV